MMKVKPYFLCVGCMAGLVCLAAATLVFLPAPALAGNFTAPPTLYVSSQPSPCTPTAYSAPLDPRNSASFRMQYFNPAVPGTVDFYPYDPVTNSYRRYFYTDGTVSDSQDFSYGGNQMTIDLSATPGVFDAKSRIRAFSSDGGDTFTGALSSVGRYFVVDGPVAGESVNLVADILFQGTVFANRNGGSEYNANAAFTNIVAVVQAPTDPNPMPQFALYMNGAASDQSWSGNNCETVPNFLFSADGQSHDINVIIRSRPFTVTTGVPYRMNLNINASAGANYAGAESSVNFFDPTLVTSIDFPVVNDESGNPHALSPSGFFLAKDGDQDPIPLGPGSFSAYTVTLLRIPVEINIRPWSKRNQIKYKGRGVIPVAILSTKEFDAPAQIDQSSLTFGVTGDEQSFAFCTRRPKDVNRDGSKDDLVCRFYVEPAGFACGDSQGRLKGRTKAGMPVEGTDRVSIIHCK